MSEQTVDGATPQTPAPLKVRAKRRLLEMAERQDRIARSYADTAPEVSKARFADASYLRAGAEAVEQLAAIRQALDVFARAYRVSMLPFAPGIDEADGAHHWMPHGWPTVADFKRANAVLADSEVPHA